MAGSGLGELTELIHDMLSATAVTESMTQQALALQIRVN
jgi:hypothetical protein